MQRIFVTGGNSGIGLALCKQLAVEHKAHVYLGSRSLERGEAAVKSILDAAPSARVELVQVDVASDESVTAAATALQASLNEAKLYAIVNNAGTGLAHGVDKETIINVNAFGPKRVVGAFLPLLDAKEGRIVNVGSGAGPMYIDKSPQDRALLTDPSVTWEQLEALLQERIKTIDDWGAYGLSKAVVAAYTMELARTYPHILSSSLSPGFINTAIVVGFGASKSPEEGTVSLRHCLFQPLAGNGWFYGSDALRSPLHVLRNPGQPAYDGTNWN